MRYSSTMRPTTMRYSSTARDTDQPIRLSNTQPNATNLQQYNCDTAYVRQQYRAICDTAVQQRTTTDTTRPRNNCNDESRYASDTAVQPATLRTAKHTTRRIRDKAIPVQPTASYASDTAVQPRITTLRYPYSTPCSDTTQPLRCARSCTRNGQQYSREL